MLKKEDDSSSWNSISHFSHDKVPVTFFVDQPSTRTFVEAARNLHTLHLSFDAREKPVAVFWARFASAISSCTELKDLRFGFQNYDNTKDWTNAAFPSRGDRILKVKVGYMLDTSIQESYIPLWRIFKRNTWPKLEKLQLDGLAVCESGLIHLISGHPTIRSLVLCQIALAHGTWKSFLTTLKNNMTLDEFLIYGRNVSVHGTDSRGALEAWRMCPPKGAWKLSAVRDAPGTEAFLKSWEGRNDGCSLLSDFVLGKSKWPETLFDEEDHVPKAEPRSASQRRHHCCIWNQDGTCSPDFDRLNDLWDWEIATGVPENWEKVEYMHRLPSDLTKIGPTFDEIGWDANGYDIFGYDEFGDHFSDLKSDVFEYEVVHKYTLNAMMRDTIEDLGKRLDKVRGKAHRTYNRRGNIQGNDAKFQKNQKHQQQRHAMLRNLERMNEICKFEENSEEAMIFNRLSKALKLKCR